MGERYARQEVAGADEVDKGCASEDDVVIAIDILDGRAGACENIFGGGF